MQLPIFFDTETCGLHGPIVLLQYAEGFDEVKLHSVWKEPIQDTLDIIEWMCEHPGGVCGFNLAFDWFHICQLYTTLSRLPDSSVCPEDCIEEYALAEAGARDGDCLKPVSACDLMLVARRGPYQSTMARKAIRIRRAPAVMAERLAQELEQRVTVKEIYFSRRKDKSAPKWQVRESKDPKTNKNDPDFRDIVMDFKASSALKVIANDLLGADRFGDRKRFNYSDIELAAKYYPAELGFAPFATALSSPKYSWRVPRSFPIKKVKQREIRGLHTWPGLINKHIDHWTYGTYAREYAADDVTDTRGIWEAFDRPPQGDVDSELACMVGAVRWRGYTLDIPKIKELQAQAQIVAKRAPRSPGDVRQFFEQDMSPIERLGFISTKKMVLEEMEKTWQVDCPECDGGETQPCIHCNSSGAVRHPVCDKVALVLAARKAKMDMQVYVKLLIAGRFHASFNVIGALSSRMSGADDLNAQAIRSEKFFRSAFTLHRPGTVLCGGDYEAFEVSLAEANYNDTKLREQLMSYTECYKCGGANPTCDDCGGTNQTKMKIHALFGTMCYPHMTYPEIVKDKIIYTRSKSGFFSQIYGGNYRTLMIRLGVSEEAALAAENRFGASYEGVARARAKIFNMFCSMRQPAGIGSHVEWHDPADFIENMLDPPFRRYFLLENQICKALFDLANKPPADFKKYKDKVQRDIYKRDRVQTAGGAVQSALYGAAFQIQAANMRAAANHVIQSTGAEITKATQLEIWNLQPSGIGRWLVQPMNIHDEIQVVVDDDPILVERVEKVVKDKVESYRPLVPLIGIDWKNNMKSWGEK